MEGRSDWLTYLPAGVEKLVSWERKTDWDDSGPHLRLLSPGSPDDPAYVLQDTEHGITLHLYPLPSLDFLFVRAWGLDQPISSDADLVSLALMCQGTDNPLLECTLGHDALITSPSDPSHDGAVAQALYDLFSLARQIRNEEFLARHAPGAVLYYAGGVVPFQAFGEWWGCEFYFRFRGGWASLDVALPGDDPVYLPAWSAGIEYGDTFDGAVDFSEFTYLFCHLATRLKRASFPYRFAVRSRPEDAADDPFVADGAITLHGLTPEDAYSRLANSRWSAWDIDPEPLNSDTRHFPEEELRFIPSTESLAQAERLISLANVRTRR